MRRGSATGGFVLMAVLIVVMLGSMLAVSLLFRLRAEQSASTAGFHSEQAWSAAMSGVREAMRIANDVSPGSLQWRDAPELFRHRFVYSDGVERWYFSVFSPADEGEEGVRYGLTDEASKLNINQADPGRMGKLMERPEADGLADYVDSDDDGREEWAEQEEYAWSAVRNGPLTTLDEILLVRGFIPALVYGEDANLNCRLDPNEDDGDETFPPDNSDGQLDFGLRQYLTVSSYDLNVDNYGLARLDLNDPEEDFSGVELSDSLKRYVAAMRREKILFKHPVELLEARRSFQGVEMNSGVGVEELGLVLDQLTATSARELPGLINLNTASARVLKTVPGISDEQADSIVAARAQLDDSDRQNTAWILAGGLVETAQFRQIAPHLTARSYQYRFRVVGYSLPSGRYRALDVMIDVGGEEPVVSYLRDTTNLGLPLPVNLEEEEEEEAGDA